MNNNEKISVLMSVYNKENPKYLYESIKSILNQTYKPSQIVIVEDGPLNKELKNVIKSYVDQYFNIFTIVKIEENKGLANALKEGINYCKYDIVARMDSDDISKEDRFEKQIRILNENKDIDIVGSYIDEYEEDMNTFISTKKVPILNDDIIRYSKKRNPFNHMSVMYRKEAVINSGNYIEFKWNEDYYLWIRMLSMNCKGYNINESLVKARTGNSMYERRGGLEYAKVDYSLQRKLLDIGYINKIQFLSNILIRMGVRLIPNSLRKQIYVKVLR